MGTRYGFTLIELMVVILIVSILAAVAVPIMRGRIDAAKWSEANTSAGSIRNSVRTYIAEKGLDYGGYSGIEGSLGTSSVYSNLGFGSSDLDGSYFNQEDYVVSDVSPDNGTCVVTVTSSHPNGPAGTGILDADGNWSVSTGSGGSSGGGDSGGGGQGGGQGQGRGGGQGGGQGSGRGRG